MKKILKRLSVLICGFLIIVCAISIFTSSKYNVSTPIRDVELSEQSLEKDSNFKSFDSYDLNCTDGKVNFIGYDSIKLSDLYDLDLVSTNTIDTEAITKYSCSYDYLNGIVSLSVSLIYGEETPIIDTIYGVIIMDEEKNFDVIFDLDGEVLLLSELQDSSLIENCGLWSKIKKVWNTKAGKVGTIITVATCATVGVICAAVPGGQLVTAACIGAAAGAVGGAITAGVSTYIKDGAVDWEAVLCYAGVGAVVGGATATVSFKITSNYIAKKTMSNILKSADKNPTSTTTYIGKYYKGSSNSYEAVAKANNGNYFNIDNYDELLKKYGSDAMEEINRNFIVTKYNAGNNIIATTNPYGQTTGAFAKEIKLLEELGGTNITWEKIGENLWKLVR